MPQTLDASEHGHVITLEPAAMVDPPLAPCPLLLDVRGRRHAHIRTVNEIAKLHYVSVWQAEQRPSSNPNNRAQAMPDLFHFYFWFGFVLVSAFVGIPCKLNLWACCG